MNRRVRDHGGWIISIPTELIVTIQCLPDSALSSELEKLGYIVDKVGTPRRILPHGITERFARRADGHLVPLTEGSTEPVAEFRRHAGIVEVEWYEAILPQ